MLVQWYNAPSDRRLRRAKTLRDEGRADEANDGELNRAGNGSNWVAWKPRAHARDFPKWQDFVSAQHPDSPYHSLNDLLLWIRHSLLRILPDPMQL